MAPGLSLLLLLLLLLLCGEQARKPRGVLRVQCLPANVVLLLEEPAETRDVGAGAGAWLMA